MVNYAKRAEKAQQVVAGIEAKGGRFFAMQTDMSRVAEARRAVINTVKPFGRPDIVVNNAGRFLPKLLADMTEEDVGWIIALHAKGPYFAVQESANVLQTGGRIVNISTVGTHMNFPGSTAHLGRKAAVEQYTKGLTQELDPPGITVNAVSPGITDTGVLTAEYRGMRIQLSTLKRVGSPKDIADVVAFLVSDDACWLTGQNIHASVGMIM